MLLKILISSFASTTGSYKLVPYYKGENTVFDVSPSSVPVSVAHQHVTVLQKFQVSCSLYISSSFPLFFHEQFFFSILAISVYCLTNCLIMQVTGFSIGGRVIDGNADGVDAVEISVDGQVRSVTDSLGYYKLDQV